MEYCTVCKKALATIHILDLQDGQVVNQQNLCSGCAETSGMVHPKTSMKLTTQALEDLIGNLKGDAGGELEGGTAPLALNAPSSKGTLSLAYRNARAGFNAEARVRATDGFPAQSADFVGTECVAGAAPSLFEEPCVDTYALVDLTVGYKVPGSAATLQLTASNLFDTGYRSFVGVPKIGRMIIARVKYDLF